MSASDSTVFPLQGAAFRIPLIFRDTFGNLITGWITPTSTIIIDGAAAVSGNAPVENASTGEGTLDLTAAQMNGQLIQVKCTVGNANMVATCYGIYTYPVYDTSTGPTTTNTVRPKDPLGKIAWLFNNFFCLHNFSRSTGIESVHSDTGGILTSGQTNGSDIFYEHDKPSP